MNKNGVRGLYRGLSPLVLFSIPKVASRFGMYEVVKKHLDTQTGRDIPLWKQLLPGFAAGATEAVVAVAPMETVKTRLVHDIIKPPPKRFTGMFQGVRVIVGEEGFRGVYRGVAACVAKQSSNQAVRFFVIDHLNKILAPDGVRSPRALPVRETPSGRSCLVFTTRWDYDNGCTCDVCCSLSCHVVLCLSMDWCLLYLGLFDADLCLSTLCSHHLPPSPW